MKLLNIILSSVLVLGLVSSCGSSGNAKKEVVEENGFVSIFDGTTTTGWRGYNKPAFPESGWEVVDGTLHCIGSGAGEAGSAGDIIFDKKLTDFELELEWKISEGGNSGIFILGQEIPEEPIYKSSPEMQILDNDKHPDARLGVDGNRMAGSLYDLIPAKPQNTKPAGEWNKAGILVYQGTVVFSSNGANVVEFHLWTEDWKKMVGESKFKDWEWFLNPAKEGYIGFQDHGNDVWFRNIKLKEL
jgi:alpha-3'-ketoglucosidase